MPTRPALAVLFLLVALPALAQSAPPPPDDVPPPKPPPNLALAVRLCSPATTGFNPMAVDSALRQGLASVALGQDAPFVLAREYESEVVVSVLGHKEDDRLELVFFLETTGAVPVRDTLKVPVLSPDLTLEQSEKIVRALVLRARALKAQALLQASAPAATAEAPPTVPTAEEDEDDEDRPTAEGPTAFLSERPPAKRTWGLVDATLTGGLNTPAGYVGGRLELHGGNWVSATAAFGYSSWGPRVTPGVRLYPFGLRLLGLYGEAVLQASLGERTHVTRAAGAAETVELKQTLSLGGVLGLRQGFGEYFTADVFVGFSAPLSQNNAKLGNGDPLDADLTQALESRQPGGLIAGAALGVSLF